LEFIPDGKAEFSVVITPVFSHMILKKSHFLLFSMLKSFVLLAIFRFLDYFLMNFYI